MRLGRRFFLFAALACAGCVFFAKETPVRVLDETPWIAVTPETGVWDGDYGRTSDPSNLSFAFQVVRRTDGIQVFARVHDDRIVTDSCPAGSTTGPYWDDDSFQCLFDGDNDGASDARETGRKIYGGEYALLANGVGRSDYSSCPKGFGTDWTGTVELVDDSSGGVVLEYRLWFSWACLGLARTPSEEEDVTFGFNASVHDDDKGGRADRALFWKGTSELPYRDERHFGKITLKGSGSK